MTDKQIVEKLLSTNAHFQALHRRHAELKEQVHDAEAEGTPLDELTLSAMKKEKLLTKDKLAAIVEHYRREHA